MVMEEPAGEGEGESGGMGSSTVSRSAEVADAFSAVPVPVQSPHADDATDQTNAHNDAGADGTDADSRYLGTERKAPPNEGEDQTEGGPEDEAKPPSTPAPAPVPEPAAEEAATTPSHAVSRGFAPGTGAVQQYEAVVRQFELAARQARRELLEAQAEL